MANDTVSKFNNYEITHKRTCARAYSLTAGVLLGLCGSREKYTISQSLAEKIEAKNDGKIN